MTPSEQIRHRIRQRTGSRRTHEARPDSMRNSNDHQSGRPRYIPDLLAEIPCGDSRPGHPHSFGEPLQQIKPVRYKEGKSQMAIGKQGFGQPVVLSQSLLKIAQGSFILQYQAYCLLSSSIHQSFGALLSSTYMGRVSGI